MIPSRRLPIAQSQQCIRGINCNKCRNLESGRPWRDSMRMLYSTPGDVVDFECPVGKPWNTVETPTCTCRNCGSREHCTAKCPIPADFDGDYRRDSGGSEGCNCA